jgi:deoxyribonuclease V
MTSTDGLRQMAHQAHWPRTPQAARALQEELAGRVMVEDQLGPVRLIAGLDVHYAPAANLTWGAAALLRFPDLSLVESVLVCRPTDFPYVPGLLSFREAPAMLDALACLSATPDLLMIDGQGIAHPRRLGLAAHVGLLADLPAIGAAKSRLTGRYEEPGEEKGAWSPLIHRRETVGAVLRSRARTRPLFVSVGHRVSLDTAIRFVLDCAPRFRLPEPTRIADRLSRFHPD